MKEKGALKPALALSVAICFMFFVYAPVELYLTNRDEFWYDLWVLLPIMTCVFVVFTLICVAVFYLLHRRSAKFYHAAVLFLFVVFVCSYIQGNYLITYLPVLDGNRIDWSLYSNGRIQSVILWIAVGLIVWGGGKFLPRKRIYGLIQVVSICILLIDTLDGGAFSDVVTGNDEMESVFEDFTYYDNTVGAYPYTKYNLPYLLSGIWYENQMPNEEYFERVLTESSFFDALEQQGYAIDLYAPDFDGINSQTRQRFENIGMYTKRPSSYTTFARWQILLVGMKYAPYDLKRFSWVNPGAFERLKTVEGNREAFHMDNNMDFYHMVTEQPIAYREDKNFKFIHLWGAHSPYLYDKDMNYIPEGGTFTQCMESCVTLADSYLKKLKESGTYDNSVIIILGDHGQGAYYEEYNWNQHPALLIKGVGEKHEFQVNSKPVSFADMQDAYIELLDGSEGSTVFDGIPDVRNRRFMWYDIKDSSHMVEYEQTGRAGDMDTLVLTGQEFNAGE